MKYGKLTIKGYLPKSKYLCDCDCGRIGLVVSRRNLLRGHTTSCGCKRKEAIMRLCNRQREIKQRENEGKKFGKLLMLRRMPFSCLFPRSSGGPRACGMALFLCDCGNRKVMRSSDVFRGSTKSCGCGKGPRRK